MKKLKNFLITAAIFAASISFATSVHAVRDYWEKELSEAQINSNFDKFENVYKNRPDLISKSDYLFAKAINERNENYLAQHCSSWKYNKDCTWRPYSVEQQLIFRKSFGYCIPSESFLNFLLEQGIITSDFNELFTRTVFDGHYESFVQNFRQHYPNVRLAACGSGTEDLAYNEHKNNLLSIEWLTSVLPYTGPNNLLYALFRHAPADDTEKFAAAAKFLIDKGAKVNTASKITNSTILEEALFPPFFLRTVNIEPFKVYFLLTQNVNTNLYKKSTSNTQPPLDRFQSEYKDNCRVRKKGSTSYHLTPDKFKQLLKREQLITYILELYKETEGNLPPYEQILSQYKFHDPSKRCSIM